MTEDFGCCIIDVKGGNKMNREIKFRGKRISNGEWLFGDLMHDNIGGCYVYPIESEELYKENAVVI